MRTQAVKTSKTTVCTENAYRFIVESGFSFLFCPSGYTDYSEPELYEREGWLVAGDQFDNWKDRFLEENYYFLLDGVPTKMFGFEWEFLS